MNILVYTQCFAPKLGGIESVMTNIASQAAILGHNVKVLADGSKYFSSKFDNNQKFEIHRFDQLKFLRKRIKSNFDKKNFKNEIFQNCTNTIIRQVNDIEKLVAEFSDFARMPATKFINLDLLKLINHQIFNLKTKQIN